MDSTAISARPDVTVATTAPRVTPTPPRTNFKEVLGNELVRRAEGAMSVLPGAPLMAVALRGGGVGTTASGSLGVPMTGVGSLGLGAGSVAGASSAAGGNSASGPTGTGGTGTGATGDPGTTSMESTLQQSQEMNIYYLQIQEQVNAQNRSFSTLSNVLKAEHDTVKTAIGNIR